jgi:glycosyltransferase involved in cell wall biosynthesis
MTAHEKRGRPTISFCMITRNEESLLPHCLDSVKGFVDEIIVVDNDSSDRTKEIANKYGAIIINNSTERDLSKQRNIYLHKARGEWILSLDADERLGASDIPKILNLINDKKAMSYGFISRLYTGVFDLLNDWFKCAGEYPPEESFSGYPGYVNIYYGYRLFRNTKGLRYEGYIHETIDRCIHKRGGLIVDTDIPIHHFKEIKSKRFVTAAAMKYFRLELTKNAAVFHNHYRHYFRIGRDYIILKNDFDKAFKYLKKAIALNPDFHCSYFLLALVYKKRGLYDEALSVLGRALRIRGDYIGAYYLRGIIYDILDRPRLAERELTSALKISPFHPMILNSLGVVFSKQQKNSKAIACFEKALKVYPAFRIALNNLKQAKDHEE